MAAHASGGGYLRSLFRGTSRNYRQNALRYNIPKKYAHGIGDAVKLFWDKPSAVEAFRTQRHTQFGQFGYPMIMPLLLLAMLPWKYEVGDWIDGMRNPISEENAVIAYYFFCNELMMQRARAYEFLRYCARPGNGMADPSGKGAKPQQPNTQAGYQAWDQTDGRPIHWYERHGKLDIFMGNTKFETKYIQDTKMEMDRIREVCLPKI